MSYLGTDKRNSDSFQWTKNWYPVSPIEYLKSDAPNFMILLDKNLVIWKNRQDDWIIMNEASFEKFIEVFSNKVHLNFEKKLNYEIISHNYDESFRIELLDNLDVFKSIAEIDLNTSKFEVNIYPTCILQDLLWVWTDDSSEAATASLFSQPATMPEDFINSSFYNWFMAEIPLGYAVLVENSFDPFNNFFIPKNEEVLASERKFIVQDYQLISEISSEGFTVKYNKLDNENKNIEIKKQFRPPSSNTIIEKFIDGSENLFQIYFIPIKPGYCRYIVKFDNSNNLNKRKFWKLFLPEVFLIGWNHCSFNRKLDEELNLMFDQENVYNQINKPWYKAYYLPSNADFGTSVFRHWLDQIVGGEPFGIKDRQKSSYKEKLDRWNNHSKICPYCRKSIHILDKLKYICRVSTSVFIALILLSIVIKAPLRIEAIFILLGLISFWTIPYIEKTKRYFLISNVQNGLPKLKMD